MADEKLHVSKGLRCWQRHLHSRNHLPLLAPSVQLQRRHFACTDLKPRAENIIISDISSLRNRVLMTILPNTLPGIINVWTGGDVAAAVLANAGWRWGIGEHNSDGAKVF